MGTKSQRTHFTAVRILWAILVMNGFLFWNPKALCAEGRTSFLFFGDSGTGEKPQFEVANAMQRFCEKQTCDFSLLLGDNFYPSGVNGISDPQWKTKFEDPYSLLQLRFFAMLGNHDYLGNIKAQIAYTEKSSAWYLPSRYYQFSQGPVDFFVLDTNDFSSAQRKWLASALTRSSALWKIVAGHHPVYSYGEHGDTKKLIKDLLPLIAPSVDFYLSGHDHDLQVLEENELTFVVSGAAAETRATGEGKRTIYSKSALGFSHLSIEEGEAYLRIVGRNGENLFETRYTKRSVFGEKGLTKRQ